MLRRWGTPLCAALVLLAPLGGLAAAEAPPGRTVRLGLVSSLFRDTSEELVKLVMQPLRAMIESDTGMAGQFVNGGDCPSPAKEVADNQGQFAVFHGPEFAWARARYPALRPLVLVAQQAKEQPRAIVVVHKDCPAAAVAELKCKTLAAPKVRGIHCELFVQKGLLPADTCCEQFFAKVTTKGGVEAALDSVFAKKCDAAVIDKVALAAYRESRPGRARELRVLTESAPFPPAVLAYLPGILPEPAIRSLTQTLLNARSNEGGQRMLETLRVHGFVEPSADFDRCLGEFVKSYPTPAENQ